MENLLPNLDTDKRNRIINAAIEEFASFPYEKASTNNIVKNAGISKGLLFHYFNSKQTLYEALIGFVIHTLYKAIVEKIDWDERDLFERVKQIAIVKLEVSRVYPHMFGFIMKMLIYKKADNVENILALYKSYGLDFQQINEDIYTKNVDYSKFRDPSTISETINIVRWSLEKYGEEFLLKFNGDAKLDFSEATAGMNCYMQILKNSFYI